MRSPSSRFFTSCNCDFVMTVAVGSMLAGASQSTTWQGFAQTVIAIAMLFLVQYSTARLRKLSPHFSTIMQNKPIVLMRDGAILEQALAETRVAKSDLLAKLREANVHDLSEVRAVVLETTGDLSILPGHGDVAELLRGTQRADR